MLQRLNAYIFDIPYHFIPHFMKLYLLEYKTLVADEPRLLKTQWTNVKFCGLYQNYSAVDVNFNRRLFFLA